MTRFSLIFSLALLALTASIVHAEELPTVADAVVANADPALRGAKPVAVADVLPLLSLDETTTNSTHNDTAAAVPSTAPTAPPTPVPTVTPTYHPVFALIMAALVLCVTNNVADADTIAAIASTAGILTSIYSLVMRLDLPSAIALSVVTIAGGNIGHFVENVRESARDVAARPLIDWDLLLIVQPTLILGVLIGVFLRNHLLPTWFLSTVLATVLLVCGSLLLQATHRRRDYQEHEAVSINEEGAEKPPSSGPPPSFNVALQSVPLNKIGVLVGVIFATAVLHAALVVAVPVVLLGYLAYKSYKKTSDSFENEQVPRSPPSQGELKWTPYIIRTMPVFSTLAGITTATVGFGSDLIFAPYLVSAGLDRAVAAATGSTIVLFASLMTGMECIVLGTVSFTVVILALIMGFVVREWGHLALERGLSENLHTPQFLSVSFAVITLIAGIALAIASI